ncbi:MAG: stage II sporulation protein M [Firmicutes bacterium]|nr:stage II sporulation protein M [Bacillota bacterium]
MRGYKEPRIRVSVVLLILILFIGGSALGAYIETGIDDTARNGALQYIDSVLKEDPAQGGGTAVFKDSLKNNGILLLAMTVGGVTVILFPAALAVITYKGMALGFTSALIMEGASGNGVLECCAALLPQNLVLIPLFGIYGYFTFCMAMSVIRCRNKRYRGRIYADNLKVYLMITVPAAIFLCITAAVEGFINPLLSGII